VAIDATDGVPVRELHGRSNDELHDRLFGGVGEPSSQPPTVTEWCGTRVTRQHDASTRGSPDYRVIPGEKGGVRTKRPSAEKKEQQPLRRSQRLSNRRPPTPECDADPIRRIIYVLGNLPEEDLTEWRRILHTFHTDDTLQDTVDEAVQSAQYYLKWRVSKQGQSYAAARSIPRLTTFCFYSGELTAQTSAMTSNHCISMGLYVGGFSYLVVIDGCTTRNAVGDAGTLGLLQMVNHSCTPNCKVVPVQTRSGIELLVLEALRDIADDEEITIDYDAGASTDLKDNDLTFWRWHPSSSPVAKGLHRITCRCAGDGHLCPNRLWRDEHSSRVVPITPDTTLGTCQAKSTVSGEHQPRTKRSFQDATSLVREAKQAKVQHYHAAPRSDSEGMAAAAAEMVPAVPAASPDNCANMPAVTADVGTTTQSLQHKRWRDVHQQMQLGRARIQMGEPHSLPDSQGKQSGLTSQPSKLLLITKQAQMRSTIDRRGPSGIRSTDRSRLKLKQQELHFAAAQSLACDLIGSRQAATPGVTVTAGSGQAVVGGSERAALPVVGLELAAMPEAGLEQEAVSVAGLERVAPSAEGGAQTATPATGSEQAATPVAASDRADTSLPTEMVCTATFAAALERVATSETGVECAAASAAGLVRAAMPAAALEHGSVSTAGLVRAVTSAAGREQAATSAAGWE